MIILFWEKLQEAAKKFKQEIKDRHVRIFSQFDTDGITSAAIMVKTLLRLEKNFELKIFKQLNRFTVEEIKPNKGDILIFLDFGSGQLNLLKDFFETNLVFVLDHHEPLIIEHENLFHLNPRLYGESEYSSSIVSYWFSRSIDSKNADLVDLAILGAIGDEQDEKWEFKGEMKKLVEEGVSLGRISVIKDLRIYGRNSRPLYKALAYTFDPYIPGISGSEAQAVQFLKEIGIEPMKGDKWRKLSDLTPEEKRKLASAIIYERLREEEAEDIFGEVYILLNRPENFQDARELSTLINACSRMGYSDIAIRLALNDNSVFEKVFEIVESYKKKISQGLSMIGDGLIEETENAIYILAGKKIPEELIGTIVSIYSNSINSKKPVFGLAETDRYIKVSGRTNKDINLRDLLVKVVEKIGGEAGGHAKAAGAYIDKGKEQEFIKAVEAVINGEKEG